MATKSHNNVSSWSPDRVSDYHDGRLYSDVEDEQPDCQAIQGSGHGTLSIHNRQHQARSLWGLISYMMSSHNKALSCLFDRAMNTRATGSSRQRQAAAGSGRQRQAAAQRGTPWHSGGRPWRAVAQRRQAVAQRRRPPSVTCRRLASARSSRLPQLAVARSLQPAACSPPLAARRPPPQPAAYSPPRAARRPQLAGTRCYPLLPAVPRCPQPVRSRTPRGCGHRLDFRQKNLGRSLRR